jgi:S1-C subfamily serine protease
MKQLFIALVLFGLLATGQAFAASQSESLSQVFKRVGPAVVVIHTSGRTVGRETGGKVVSVQGSGSGVLVSGDGKVVTAAHVVHAADAVAVEFPGGLVVRARVIASDPAADLALLELERVPPGAVTAKLGDSATAEVGDQILIVGAPLGMTHTLTVGHLSARRKMNATYGGMEKTELFQTDAAINPGNSGGPLLNSRGEVIGINTAIFGQTNLGIGFAIPIDSTKGALTDLIRDGRVHLAFLGVVGQEITAPLAGLLNLPAEQGLLIAQLTRGGPAEQAGLRAGRQYVLIGNQQVVIGGDLLVEADGAPLYSVEDLNRYLRRKKPGDVSKVTFFRDGRRTTLDVKLGDRSQFESP